MGVDHAERIKKQSEPAVEVMAPQAEESGRRRKLEQADCKQDCGQNSTVLTGGGEIASKSVSSSTSKRSNPRCWMAEGTTTPEPSCNCEAQYRLL